MTVVVARIALVLALRMSVACMVQGIPLAVCRRAHGSVAEVAAAHEVAALIAEVLEEAVDTARQAVCACHAERAHIVPVGLLCLLEPYGLKCALELRDGTVVVGDTDDVGPHVVEELYPMVELPEVVAIVAYAGAGALAPKACGVGFRTQIDGSCAHDVGQVLILVHVAVVPYGEEDGMSVAAVGAVRHLYARVHAVGADSHLIGGRLLVFAGIHHLEVRPIVALARRRTWNLRAPPEVNAGSHEYLGVGDVEGRCALEEEEVEAVRA